jgi:hypothetical protein
MFHGFAAFWSTSSVERRLGRTGPRWIVHGSNAPHTISKSDLPDSLLEAAGPRDRKPRPESERGSDSRPYDTGVQLSVKRLFSQGEKIFCSREINAARANDCFRNKYTDIRISGPDIPDIGLDQKVRVAQTLLILPKTPTMGIDSYFDLIRPRHDSANTLAISSPGTKRAIPASRYRLVTS